MLIFNFLYFLNICLFIINSILHPVGEGYKFIFSVFFHYNGSSSLNKVWLIDWAVLAFYNQCWRKYQPSKTEKN